METLNNLNWIQNRIKELILLRRKSSLAEQKRINVQLTWFYNQKYK